MKLPLGFDFETVADGVLDHGPQLLRREAARFLENIESSSLMGTLRPDQVGVIATNAMQLATEKFADFEADEKREAMGWLITALAHLKRLEVRMAELREEITDIEKEINILEGTYAVLNSELMDINGLLDPSRGGEGDYDRAKALKILGLPPESETADGDIQALLWERKVKLTEDMTNVEEALEINRRRLHEANAEFDQIQEEASSLRQSVESADTPEDLRATGTQIEESKKLIAESDDTSLNLRSQIVSEAPAPSGMGSM